MFITNSQTVVTYSQTLITCSQSLLTYYQLSRRQLKIKVIHAVNAAAAKGYPPGEMAGIRLPPPGALLASRSRE
jgi:hypothetical protein